MIWINRYRIIRWKMVTLGTVMVRWLRHMSPLSSRLSIIPSECSILLLLCSINCRDNTVDILLLLLLVHGLGPRITAGWRRVAAVNNVLAWMTSWGVWGHDVGFIIAAVDGSNIVGGLVAVGGVASYLLEIKDCLIIRIELWWFAALALRVILGAYAMRAPQTPRLLNLRLVVLLIFHLGILGTLITLAKATKSLTPDAGLCRSILMLNLRLKLRLKANRCLVHLLVHGI